MLGQFQHRIDQLVKIWAQEEAKWEPVRNPLKGRPQLGAGDKDRECGMKEANLYTFLQIWDFRMTLLLILFETSASSLMPDI